MFIFHGHTSHLHVIVGTFLLFQQFFISKLIFLFTIPLSRSLNTFHLCLPLCRLSPSMVPCLHRSLSRSTFLFFDSPFSIITVQMSHSLTFYTLSKSVTLYYIPPLKHYNVSLPTFVRHRYLQFVVNSLFCYTQKSYSVSRDYRMFIVNTTCSHTPF